MRHWSLLLGAALSLSSCASLKVSDFERGRPIFEPTAFFTGRTSSFGVMENRGGAPTRTVTTATNGHWIGNTLYVEQDVVLGADSKPQHRSWRIRKIGAHQYEATANDIVGIARGEARGNVFHWSFTLALSPGNLSGNVRMTQWMYLQPDGQTMLNHSTIRKFGVLVAQVTEEFRRQGGATSR
jgi:Protein of unknown function (DUF3833)